MKIAVFIKGTTFHKTHGGLETFNKTLCEGLASRGHEVTVFSPKRELTIDDVVSSGVKYFFVQCTYRQFFSHVDSSSWLNRSYQVFKALHSTEHFDIVLGQSSGALGIIERKNELKVKVISISHGSILGEYKTALKNISGVKDVLALTRNTQYVLRAYFGSQRDFIRNSNKVIAVSNAVRRSIIDETFIPEAKVEVIFNGVDEAKFSKQHIKNNAPSALFLGRVIRSKGILLLISALMDDRLKNMHLNIVGDGEDMDVAKNLVAQSHLSDRVQFKGWLPPNEVIEELFKNDLFVLPSLRIEGFPMTLVEAMFAGLPIIASDIGGISDAVKNEYNGLLVTPNDLNQLRDALARLVKDEDIRQKYGYNSRTKAMSEFTLATMLDKYEKVLHDFTKVSK